VGFHYGVAPRRDLAPVHELPNTAGLSGLRGRRPGCPDFIHFSSNAKSSLTMAYGIDNSQPREAGDDKAVSVAVLSAPGNASETLMADTINTGTMPIEAGALVPESLRFESQPWTFLYMAGEVIRELRRELQGP
jgi:hypothetical protein